MGAVWSDSFTAHRVLVLEWLTSDKDRRTGSELVVASSRFHIPKNLLELHICATRRDVLDCIALATAEVTTKGVPILHIEAHGVEGRDGGFSAGNELLSWDELRDPLSALNIATRFNLLLVGASCFGEGALWPTGAKIAPAPFLGCVGIKGKIKESSLLSAMTEFYRAILVDHENIEIAVQAAQREIKNPGEIISYTAMRDLVKASLRNFYFDDCNSAPDPEAYAACKLVVSSLFAYEEIPENRARFRMDLKSILS